MSFIDDLPQLMTDRYDLMKRRQRWRGVGDGASLCYVATVGANLMIMALGAAPMSGWMFACCPAVSLLALWRLHCADKAIEAIDAGLRETAKAPPQPKPEKAMVN